MDALIKKSVALIIQNLQNWKRIEKQTKPDVLFRGSIQVSLRVNQHSLRNYFYTTKYKRLSVKPEAKTRYLRKSSIVDVRLGFKYVSESTYMI